MNLPSCRRRSLLVFLVMIFIIPLACELPGRATPTLEPGALETAVAATLEVMGLPLGTPDSKGGGTANPPEGTPAVTETSQPVTPSPTATAETVLEPVLRVAFINDTKNVIYWDELVGEAKQLTTGGNILDLDLSDDGELIAYTHMVDENRTELWVVNTEGTEERLLMGAADFKAFDPEALGVIPYQLDWVPGTHELAFNTRETFEGPGLQLYNDIRYIDVDTGEMITFFEPGAGGTFTFSPDGKQMAVMTPTSISLVNVDATNLRKNVVIYPSVITYSEYAYYATPYWSQDSQSLLVAIPPADPLADPAEPTTLWRIPTDGSPGTVIRQVLASPFFGSEIRFSPDQNKIAYTQDVDGSGSNHRALVIENLDGTGQVIYQTNNLFFKSWAPDSKFFVYQSFDPNAVFLGRVGVAPVLLGDTGSALDVKWLDATHYLFVSRGEVYWELRLGEIGGSSQSLGKSVGTLPLYDFDQ